MGFERIHSIIVAALLSGLIACDGPPSEGFLVEPIRLEEVSSRLAAGPTRVELELFPDWGERTVRELELRPEHRLRDDERVESRVVSPGFAELSTGARCSGALTLALPGVQIRFDERTRFEDQDGDRIACIDFVTYVEAYVALGQEPQITAERRPLSVPQPAADPVFFADELRIDDEDDDGDQRPELELNLGPENLASCEDIVVPVSDCVAAVHVLGSLLAITSERSELKRGDPEPRLEVGFRGIVRSVDPVRQELRLTSGAVLRMVVGSDLEHGRPSAPSEVVGSLEDAERLRRLGRLVEAHGTAAVLSTDPLVLWVRELELEVERDLGAEAYAPVVTLQGDVLDASVGEHFVELPFDTRLRVTEVSAVEGEYPDVVEVGSAVTAGRRIRATARVVVEEFQYPVLVTRADRVAFFADGPE